MNKCIYFSILRRPQHRRCLFILITYWPNMGNTGGKHTWVSCGSHVGPLRGETHGYNVENCCILQCVPLVTARVWPMKGTHVGHSWGPWNFAICVMSIFIFKNFQLDLFMFSIFYFTFLEVRKPGRFFCDSPKQGRIWWFRKISSELVVLQFFIIMIEER